MLEAKGGTKEERDREHAVGGGRRGGGARYHRRGQRESQADSWGETHLGKRKEESLEVLKCQHAWCVGRAQGGRCGLGRERKGRGAGDEMREEAAGSSMQGVLRH